MYLKHVAKCNSFPYNNKQEKYYFCREKINKDEKITK